MPYLSEWHTWRASQVAGASFLLSEDLRRKSRAAADAVIAKELATIRDETAIAIRREGAGQPADVDIFGVSGAAGSVKNPAHHRSPAAV